MDGYTLLREWKADPLLASTPFIVYTATYTEPQDEKLALDLGADAFLLKPMEPEHFLAELNSTLKRDGKTVQTTTFTKTELLKTYSEALVRKLEARSRQLELTNRALQEDIVRREAVENALRLSEERFRLLAKATSDAAWDWDLATEELWWNGNFFQLLGSPAPTTIDTDSWLSLIHPADQPAVLDVHRHISHGTEDNWLLHYRIQHAEGHWVTIEDRGYLLRDPNGKPTRMVGGLTDITLRKALEEQVRQAQRMDAVGQLTGGVAHDFNNLLTVVLGNAHELSHRLEGQPALQNMAHMITAAAERGSDLTRRLLAFARKQALSPQPVDINLLIGDMLPLLHQAVGGDIEIEIHQSNDIPLALVDSGQLEHALLNLCINARDAMPDGGKLTLTSDIIMIRNGKREPEELVPGPYVLLTVSDTGSGIAAEHLEHIFEPFFSTKSEGKGSGLGLAMVYGFARQSGGLVNVASGLGKGTTFRLYLPATSEKQRQPLKIAPSADSIQGEGEHILLVEDDDLIRDFARSLLESLDYRVTALAEGPAALALLRSNEVVDLLFSDMLMSAMSGPDLVREARGLRPDLAVLFTTGFAGCNGEEPTRNDNIPVLYKPYRREALAQAVRKALE